METLTIARQATRLDDNHVYCEWRITNDGIENTVMHGMTLQIVGTITATLDAYQSTARDAILLELEKLYPGLYQ